MGFIIISVNQLEDAIFNRVLEFVPETGKVITNDSVTETDIVGVDAACLSDRGEHVFLVGPPLDDVPPVEITCKKDGLARLF